VFVDPVTGSVNYVSQTAIRRTYIIHIAGIFRAASRAVKKK
jgi:hypothetical protein